LCLQACLFDQDVRTWARSMAASMTSGGEDQYFFRGANIAHRTPPLPSADYYIAQSEREATGFTHMRSPTKIRIMSVSGSEDTEKISTIVAADFNVDESSNPQKSRVGWQVAGYTQPSSSFSSSNNNKQEEQTFFYIH